MDKGGYPSCPPWFFDFMANLWKKSSLEPHRKLASKVQKDNTFRIWLQITHKLSVDDVIAVVKKVTKKLWNFFK
jgi:2,4-dienoyl-CoA reductase-like NADH-dependent reductase (Old Yellow Enzyme family)